MSNNPDISPDSFSDLAENLSGGSGWVLYRLPGTKKIQFIAGPVSESVDANGLFPSFLIAPFESDSKGILRMSVEKEFHFEDSKDLPALLGLPLFVKEQTGTSTSESQYISLVEDVLKEIADGSLKKAVPARTMQIDLPKGFSELEMFESLLNAYPDAFVYLLSTMQTGTWTGCSPELLLKARDNNVETLSLAGTKKTISAEISAKVEAFTDKEFDEQEIVTDYIKNIMNGYCSGISIKGPDIQRAGNVTHLATRISGTLRTGAAFNYGALLKSLHPTPAVCGFPKEDAMKFLSGEEGFDRSFYSGFLGHVTGNSADVYVNLRCMEIFKNTARLYAGAGIVPGSLPKREWLETEEKMQTLLAMITGN